MPLGSTSAALPLLLESDLWSQASQFYMSEALSGLATAGRRPLSHANKFLPDIPSSPQQKKKNTPLKVAMWASDWIRPFCWP